MKSKNRQFLLLQAGFTLVEIMVGMVIGMLATIIIMQVFSVFETQKRTTTGTADAQTNGSIALYAISRELQMAGYPLMPRTNSALECTTLTIDGVAGFNYADLSPAVITDGVSDSLSIRYGNAPSGGSPDKIKFVGNPNPNDVTLDNNLGCQVGDKTLVIKDNTCSISSASAVIFTSGVTLTNIDAAVATGAQLACLGNWGQITFAVNNGDLQRNGVTSVAGVVNLQAQYGISDIAASNQVTKWVDATNDVNGNWALPSLAERNRIKALRVAVVARNAKMEAEVVTTACSSLVTSAPTGLCAWPGSASSPAPAIDLSADANWQRYRYRVFETIIPLRNMIWAKGTL
jgi:type IV pilus assembly protein PilW